MEDVLKGGAGAVFLFFYLFPGLLGSVVYDYLVEGPKRENFERIVVALSLTLLSSVALKFGFSLPLLPLVVDDKTPVSAVIDAFFSRNLLYATLLSVVIAAVLAALNNNGKTFAALKILRITNKASSLDVWADTFDRFRGYWVRIRFRMAVRSSGGRATIHSSAIRERSFSPKQHGGNLIRAVLSSRPTWRAQAFIFRISRMSLQSKC